MNMPFADQAVQYMALFLATIGFILSLYVLLLNPSLTANRHVSFLLFLGALVGLGQGLLLGARSMQAAYMPTLILSATVGGIQPLLFVTAIVLVRPGWILGSSASLVGMVTGKGVTQEPPHRFGGRGVVGWLRRTAGWRRLWLLVYALIPLPALLTLIDILLGTQLWYTGLDPATYVGGYVSSAEYTSGSLSFPIKLVVFQILSLLIFLPLLYVALGDKVASRLDRRLAWVLLAEQGITVTFSLGLRGVLADPIPNLVSTFAFFVAYTYVVFQQMASGRRVQRGRLRPRITALVLVVAIPLLIVVASLVSMQAGTELEEVAAGQLESVNRALASNLSGWLESNVRALHQLVILPDIVSMDPQAQRPVLQAMAAAYPYMYLVSTTDLNGINIARNDEEEPKDYSDRYWFREPVAGSPLAFQSLIGRTSDQPALVVSMPIKDHRGELVGVGMFASTMTDIASEVEASRVGDSGYAYVVDADNKVIAHPDPAFYQADALVDLSDAPPIVALRQGTRGFLDYADDAGERWLVYVDQLENGWGVVVQQQESELLAVRQSFQTVSWLLIAGGALVLLVLTWLTISQAFRPVDSLAATAQAIAAGDLTAEAPVQSEDEIGALARAFNNMTGQLRGLIDSLEQRVADRTRDLERRTRYLAATAQVGRAAAVILETEQLIQEVVELIREQFDLYYVGLFLVDEPREWAVLQAGTGQAGRAMLARGHQIRVGEGMIGWSVEHADSRVALDVGEDAVRLATSELPETRSEAALPLRSRGQVLGALTVQHTQAGAFDEDTIAVLQIMADQVAVAIDNARLFRQTEEALEAERRVHGEVSVQAWEELLRARPGLGYRSDEQGVVPADIPAEYRFRSGGLQTSTAERAAREPGPQAARERGPQAARERGPQAALGGARAATALESAGRELVLPIKIQDRVLGSFVANKAPGREEWSEDEIALIEALNDQLSLALESARLYGETRRRAFQDRMLGEITTRMRETLDVESVLQTAIRELGEALGMAEVEVRMRSAALSAAGIGRARSSAGDGRDGSGGGTS